MIKTESIIRINRKHGGVLINRGNLEFAVDAANSEGNIYRSNAHLLRGIIQNHPFSDGNKSTASEIVLGRFSKRGIDCDKEPFERGMVRLARENNTPLIKIEGRLRKWCRR